MKWRTLAVAMLALGCGSLTGAVAVELRDVVPVVPSDVPTRVIEEPKVEAGAEAEAEPPPEVEKEEPEMPFPTREEIEEGIYYGEMLYV